MSKNATAKAPEVFGQPRAAAQQAQTPAPASPVPVAPVEHTEWREVSGGGIVLRKPLILLDGHHFINAVGETPNQVNKITPERAFISHGCVFIDELKIWFPLSQVTIGKAA